MGDGSVERGTSSLLMKGVDSAHHTTFRPKREMEGMRRSPPHKNPQGHTLPSRQRPRFVKTTKRRKNIPPLTGDAVASSPNHASRIRANPSTTHPGARKTHGDCHGRGRDEGDNSDPQHPWWQTHPPAHSQLQSALEQREQEPGQAGQALVHRQTQVEFDQSHNWTPRYGEKWLLQVHPLGSGLAKPPYPCLYTTSSG